MDAYQPWKCFCGTVKIDPRGFPISPYAQIQIIASSTLDCVHASAISHRCYKEKKNLSFGFTVELSQIELSCSQEKVLGKKHISKGASSAWTSIRASAARRAPFSTSGTIDLLKVVFLQESSKSSKGCRKVVLNIKVCFCHKKKKSGAGSASKLKKLDELAPIVALPATNDGDATTSAAANPTGEAMTGEIGVALVDELGGGAPAGIMADPSSSFEAPVTVKSTSTNRKVLLESQNSKTAAKSVSFAGNVQFSDGTEAGKAGYSSMKVQPAEKLISSTDKAQNSTGGGPSIANSIAENAGNPGNADNPNSGAAAGILSTNAQNHCINSKCLLRFNYRLSFTNSLRLKPC